MQRVQALEVHVAAVHDVEGTGFECQHVEHVDVVQFAVADVDEGWDRPAQVQQRVQLDGRLGGAKRRPVEQGQTQIDGAGVQRVDRVVQANVQRIARVKFAGSANQHRSQVRPDAPVAGLVGIGQRGAFDGRAKAHRIQLARIGRQTRLDIAQALAPGQLRERHRTQLLGARQRAHAGVAVVALHDAREARPRHEFHDLCEQRLSNIHRHSSGTSTPRNYLLFEHQNSNRHQMKSPANPRHCLLFGLPWPI